MLRALAPWLLLATACSPDITIGIKDGGPEDTVPLISVTPDRVDFGLKSSLDVVRETVTVRNDGTSALFVDEIVLKSDASFELDFAHGDLPFDLDPAETASFDVVFTPSEAGSLGGDVRIISDADNEPELVVPILGEGAVPSLIISPDPMVFGDRFIPCDTQSAFILQNMGNEPLVVTSVGLEGDVEQISFAQGDPLVPFTLGKGDTQVVPILFDPTFPQTIAAELVVDSNDLAGQARAGITAGAKYAIEKVDTFQVPPSIPVNILFAVDQSCSMGEQQTVLNQSIQDFIAIFDAADVDVKIGVTTGGASACFNGGVIRTSQASWRTTFATAIAEGDDYYPNTERLIQAVSASVDASCNAGFRDAGAPLHVIYISDEADQSTGYTDARPFSCSTSQTGGCYWASHYTKLQAYAGVAAMRAHAIVDRWQQCGGPPNNPWAYEDLAAITGGQRLDICNGGWAASFQNIATQALGDLTFYKMSSSGAHPDSIVVTVDGAPVTDGWTYDRHRGGVVFDEVPAPNSTIVVTYGVSPTCP